jgi:ribosomal protein L7Ae-like RNA K-turn-binding protein
LSEENLPVNAARALSLLGMARRAGVLLVGQDQVFAPRGSLAGGRFVVTTSDCSPNVLRKLEAAGGNAGGRILHSALEGVNREELGRSLGVRSAQIAALPLKSGFAKKLAVLLQQEGLA